MEEYDVIIAGVGPAGGNCAKDISQKGYSVLLLESSKIIGEPDFSTAGTPNEALEVFRLPKKVVDSPWSSILTAGPNENVEFVYKKRLGYALNYKKLKQFLAAEARKHGATVLTQSIVKSPTVKDGKVVGVTAHIDGEKKEFLRKAKKLEGCGRKELAQHLHVNAGTLKNWTKESRLLPTNVYERIVTLHPHLKPYMSKVIEQKEDNWGQIKGGIISNAAVCKKLRSDPKFRAMWVKNSKKGGTNNIKNGLIKNWDVGFRNIGKRRFEGPKKEKMFTEAEKRLAEFFAENKINYEYEQLLVVNEKSYFPDFTIDGKIIVERCAVISAKYFHDLQFKLNNYKKLDKQVILIFPKKYRNVLFRNVKIPKGFSCIIEENEFEETAKNLKELIQGLSSSLV